jgi:polyisoprenoid-binding protein YceI
MSGACTLTLDARNTEVTFAVSWWRLLTVRGRFEELRGELRIPNGDLESSSIVVDVDAGSIRTGLPLRDRHLRGPQFLDAGHFPRIAFQSRKVERLNGTLTITGEMTLRGVLREIVAQCPLGWAQGEGLGSTVALETSLDIPRLPHGVGAASGIHRLNPLLHAIGPAVHVHVRMLVPATRLLPALLPALGR